MQHGNRQTRLVAGAKHSPGQLRLRSREGSTTLQKSCSRVWVALVGHDKQGKRTCSRTTAHTVVPRTAPTPRTATSSDSCCIAFAISRVATASTSGGIVLGLSST